MTRRYAVNIIAYEADRKRRFIAIECWYCTVMRAAKKQLLIA